MNKYLSPLFLNIHIEERFYGFLKKFSAYKNYGGSYVRADTNDGIRWRSYQREAKLRDIKSRNGLFDAKLRFALLIPLSYVFIESKRRKRRKTRASLQDFFYF